MTDNQWGLTKVSASVTRLSTIWRQTFLLTKRGYFKWLLIILPIYVVLFLLTLLLTRNSHVIQVTLINTSTNTIYTSKRFTDMGLLDLYLLLSIFAKFFTGVLVPKSIAATYFGYVPTDRSTLRVSSNKLAKTFLAAPLIMIGLFIGSILLIVPGIIWCLTTYLVITIIALENQYRFWDFFRRSRQLTTHNKGRLFIALLMMIIPIGIISTTITLLTLQSDISVVVEMLLITLIAFLLTPLECCLAFVFYIDLRIQKEGISHEQLASAIGMAVDLNGQGSSSLSNNSPIPPYGASYSSAYQTTNTYQPPETDPDVLPDFFSQSGFGVNPQEQSIPDPSSRTDFGYLPHIQDLPYTDNQIEKNQNTSASDGDDDQTQSNPS